LGFTVPLQSENCNDVDGLSFQESLLNQTQVQDLKRVLSSILSNPFSTEEMITQFAIAKSYVQAVYQ
jgi:hypothetical protein